jgi:hypothetical protein
MYEIKYTYAQTQIGTYSYVGTIIHNSVYGTIYVPAVSATIGATIE